METTRLSSKGQLILPKALRNAHNLQPGQAFEVEDTPAGILLRPVKPFKPTRHRDVFGCTGYRGATKSLKDMEQAIRQEAGKHK